MTTNADGLFQQKSKQGGRVVRTWNFLGYWRKSIWKFQGYSKSEVGSGISRDLGIWPWYFQEVYKILQNFQGKLLFCGISKSKAKNLKIPGFFSEPPRLNFFWNSPSDSYQQYQHIFSSHKYTVKVLMALYC